MARQRQRPKPKQQMTTTLKTALALLTLALLLPDAPVRAQVAAATTPTDAAQAQRLQGTWEGVLVGQESAGKITITFTGHSLHFQGLSTNQWYDATFTLPAGTSPQQLSATITACERAKDIGSVIGAIFRIEDGMLTLAGIQARNQEAPKGFGEDKPLFKIETGSFNFRGASAPDASKAFEGNTMFRYDLKKVPAHPKQVESSKANSEQPR